MDIPLPEVKWRDLPTWDGVRELCCGYLSKKASKTSAFSKGKWQKRWFVIDIRIEGLENYFLEYFYHPDDRTPRATFPLANAAVKLSGGTNFVLSFGDGSNMTLSAADNETMNDWVETVERVAAVASTREKFIKGYDSLDENDLGGGDRTVERSRSFMMQSMESQPVLTLSLTGRGKEYPMVRLDVDIETIPPGTTARHKFLSTFIDDISKALECDTDIIEIKSLRAAPGMAWLTIVEFDINISSEMYDLDQGEPYTREERISMRSDYLSTLYNLVTEASSNLYNGFVTCKLDPSYAKNFFDEDEEQQEIVPISDDQAILDIMNKYKYIDVPTTFKDKSFFTIYLAFEGRMRPCRVPNPAILKKSCCAIWPHEVMRILGFTGTMQEMWMKPLSLTPRDLPKAISDPVEFKPSVRANGELLINATHLRPDVVYDVQCTDRRDEALNSLSKEEMDAIKNTFQMYDINGDGGISKPELEVLVRQRTQARKEAIEEKFHKYINEPGITKEEIEAAEESKAQFLEHTREAQVKLMNLFEAADVDGDGVISFTEFIMAEAWWLRCTINPDRAHLF